MVAAAHVAIVVAAVAIAVPAAATAVTVAETDSADCSVAAVVAVDADTEAVAHFEELQKLCLLDPSC